MIELDQIIITDHIIIMLLFVSTMIISMSFYFEKKFLKKHQEIMLELNGQIKLLDSRQTYLETEFNKLSKLHNKENI